MHSTQMDDEFDVEALLTAQAGLNDEEDGLSDDQESTRNEDKDLQKLKGGFHSQMARIQVSSSDANIHYNLRAIGSVVSFISGIDEALANQQEERLLQLYLRQYYQMSEKVFRQQLWPDQIDESEQKMNPLTLLLYHELRMRHLYSQKVPTLMQRIDSWECFMHLIDEVMDQASDIRVFPLQWAWDILDEFLYQFQSFCFSVQIAIKQGKAEMFLTEESEETKELEDRLPTYWSKEGVADILDAFIERISITDGDELTGIRASKPHEDMASALGYFAFVCKIRYFIVSGEFQIALDLLAMINPKKEHPIFNKVVPCYVSLFYHAGYAFLMTHNYIEAMRCFSNVLVYTNRARSFCARSYQYDQLTKCQEQSLYLLMIANTLCPWNGLDSQVYQMMQEHRHLNTFKKLQNGNLTSFDQKLRFGSPRFLISSHELLLEKDKAMNLTDHLTTNIMEEFMSSIKDQRAVSCLHKFLQSYEELSYEKLGKLMGVEEKEAQRLVHKLKERFNQKVSGVEGGFKLVREENFEDPRFEIKGNKLLIAKAKNERKFIAGFSRAIFKLKEMQNKII